MNSHEVSDKDLFDLRLRREIKKWIQRQSPPANLRGHLLFAAARETTSRESWLDRLATLSRGRENNAPSFELFAKTIAYSLQIGVLTAR
ncbi:MAG: hypothetical protein FJ010_10240 [Chloroflexi bacterium]|nr:hypothetical protein [Chloroflexota bacterium]